MDFEDFKKQEEAKSKAEARNPPKHEAKTKGETPLNQLSV
jgi:hypothetical protein